MRPEDHELARARMLADSDRYRDALTILQPLLARSSDSAEVWRLIALCQLGDHKPIAAITAARESLALDPESEWAHRLHSSALSEAKLHREARRAAEQAIRVGPYVWQAHLQRANVDIDADEIRPSSWEAAREAARLAPNRPEVHTALGRLGLAVGDRRLALAEFREALRLNPNNAIARNNLAVAQIRQLRLFSSGSNLIGALRLEPNSPLLAQNLRLVFRTWAYLFNAVGILVCVLLFNISGAHSVAVPHPQSSFIRVSDIPVPSGTPDVVISVAGGTSQLSQNARIRVPTGLRTTRPSGRPGYFSVFASIMVIALLGFSLILRRMLGRSARQILGASFRTDPKLRITAFAGVAGLTGVVLAAAIGLPAARIVLGVTIAIDFALTVIVRRNVSSEHS